MFSMTKKELSILLSRLKGFDKPEIKLEQHPTDSEIAGEVLWNAFMQEDIRGKIIADLGCGTGILGLGALLLGAKKAFLVDIDAGAVELAMQNKAFLENETGQKLNAVFCAGDINVFDEKADVVIMNPPFGTKNENIDTVFLLKAMDMVRVIYSFHKASTKNFIDTFIQENGFETTHYTEYDFPLKMTMAHHTKKIEKIRVGLWRLRKEIIPTAGVLIYHDDEVLLVKLGKKSGHIPGVYGVPSGRIEDKETEIQAAIREFKEETGLTVKPDDLIEVPRSYIAPIQVKDEVKKYSLTVYIARKYSGKLRECGETSPGWVKISELSKYKLLPNTERIVKEGLNFRQP